ncbi:hypothetical protein V1525DRAFT_390835 [Lipomyces kononenkoae]|uniref:Uncharacterized protein n=1 Tax=Lipomyces kononenkoae TaxID=34357 RepID=A0ACC3SW88_LIPKO
MSEEPMNVEYQSSVEDHLPAEDEAYSMDEHAQDKPAGEAVELITDDSVNLNSARSWSESLAKLEALRNPKLSDSEVKSLDAIKNYSKTV